MAPDSLDSSPNPDEALSYVEKQLSATSRSSQFTLNKLYALRAND
jgi:hypothetical protein